MGPSLSGLDKLLRMPTGCGEQNMLGFTPNIYVLQYLTSTNQLTSDVENKAKSYMKTGKCKTVAYCSYCPAAVAFSPTLFHISAHRLSEGTDVQTRRRIIQCIW